MPDSFICSSALDSDNNGLLQEQDGLQKRLEENDLQEQECLRA